MPKFLDAPQWYSSTGTLIDMGTPGTAVAGKYFGTNATGTIGYHNNQFASLNNRVPNGAVIYAPTSQGTEGQVLVSNGSGAPSWETKRTFCIVSFRYTVGSNRQEDYYYDYFYYPYMLVDTSDNSISTLYNLALHDGFGGVVHGWGTRTVVKTTNSNIKSGYFDSVTLDTVSGGGRARYSVRAWDAMENTLSVTATVSGGLIVGIHSFSLD